MNRYSTEEMTLTGMLKRAVRLHYLTLKHVIVPVIGLTILKYVYLLLLTLFTNPIIGVVIDFFTLITVIFLMSIALLSTHLAFLDKSQPLTTTINQILKRSLTIYATVLAYFVGAIIIFEIMNGIVILVHRLMHIRNALHGGSILIGWAFVLVFIAMFFFAWPLTVIEEKQTIRGAFTESLFLSDKNKFGILAFFFLLLMIWLSIAPGTIHEYLLSTYHLNLVFDFIILSVGIPLLTNLLLFLIADSKQKVVTVDI